jgi:hypothetical protein
MWVKIDMGPGKGNSNASKYWESDVRLVLMLIASLPSIG